MLKLNHKKLEVYKFSIELIAEIYKTTEHFPNDERFNLTNQMRRAAVSIASNIAEGSARKSNTERKRFYEISRSSLVEIDTQLEICKKLGIISEKEISPLSDLMNSVFAMLSKLIKNT